LYSKESATFPAKKIISFYRILLYFEINIYYIAIFLIY